MTIALILHHSSDTRYHAGANLPGEIQCPCSFKTQGDNSMFCVIQEIQAKRPDKNGYPKELISEYIKMTIGDQDCSHYYYTYSEERFKRPLKPSYRISIHSSYRKDGKPRKRQYVICTVKYYELATGWFSLYDWGDARIQSVASELNVDVNTIYDLIEAKLEPLKVRIIEEFHETEEYKTHGKHEEITTIYAAKKTQFAKKYGVDSSEYDKIYDVFGKLQNPAYLEKIKADYEERKEYERKSNEYSRSYYEKFYSNYNGGQESSYCGSLSGNYNLEEKAMLKKFYRTLSKTFHPDSNPNEDTSAEMKMLNQLKNDWGI